MHDDMKLPAGKTCGDCKHFNRCEWLISCKPTNEECDWSPSRFILKTVAPNYEPKE